MIGAKHFDPVIGVDIHIINIPTPGGPLPTPIPHPFAGIVFDPVDLFPIIGATVMVNGIPVGVAGTAVTNDPPGHIPMGGPFFKPPANEGEIFMGSMTVKADGAPFSYLGLPVLTCSDIGVPPPPRSKKKGGTKSITLPTSVVLSVPMGMPVLVGGPPTIDLMAIVMKLGISALGKGLKKLRNSKFMKKISDDIHDKAKKIMDKKGVSQATRDKVHKSICTVTGHPVDIATGKVFTDSIDFDIPGAIPIIWERTWYSTAKGSSQLGRGWYHAYDLVLVEDTAEQIIALRMNDGRSVAFPSLKIGEEFYARAEKLTLFRDEKGYGIRNQELLTHRFHQNQGDVWALASISNLNEKSIQFEYDTLGALQQIIDSNGRILTIQTDYEGRILAIEAPHPTVANQSVALMRYEYDIEGHLIKAIDALDYVFSYQYKNKLLVKETNRTGLSFYFEYEGSNHDAKCLRTWGDHGIYNHKLIYEKGLTTVENSLGYKTKHYHKGGLVYHQIDPKGNEQFFEYNEYNELLSETNPLGLQITYDKDSRGNTIATNYPDGTSLQLAYNEQDQLEGAKDQLGGRWTWLYDSKQRLIRRIDVLERSTIYTYNETGDLNLILDATGGKTILAYDDKGNLNQITTPDNASTRWEYDHLGRVTKSIDPKGNIQERFFDLKGQIIEVKEADGNHRWLKYDGESNLVHAKDKQHNVRFEYQGMGRLKTRIENNTEVRFKYDTEENLIAIVNEHASVYQFDLNENGEVEVESGFDEVKRFYRRDAAGRVILVARASGIETTYGYDLMDRVTKVVHSNGESESYAYRADGELIEANNTHSKVSFQRDAVGRVTKEVQNTYVVQSEYDIMGMRTHLQSSLGLQLNIQRNTMGDVLGMKAMTNDRPWEIEFTRDIMGLELERLMPGGIKSKWERDNVGRPIRHQITGGGGKQHRDREYVWDVNDRLKRYIDFGKAITSFEHDKFGNLAGASYPDGSQEYRMPDAVGNLFRKRDRSDRKYGPAGQLLEANGTRYSYDAEGNLIQKTTPNGALWRYEWNGTGMLQKVIRPDGEAVEFTYDALGRRLSKTYKNKSTRWVWDGNVLLHEWIDDGTSSAPILMPDSAIESIEKTDESDEFDIIIDEIDGTPSPLDMEDDLDLIIIEEVGIPTATISKPKVTIAPKLIQTHPIPTNMVTWLFEPESFSPIAKLVDDRQFNIQTDHLGTPISMFDELGEKIWAADTSTYGDLRNLVGNKMACPFRYPGQYEDEETGLYYNRFRYYDKEGGFYVSQDPIGLEGDNPNLYAYVADVLIWIDIFGCSVFSPTTWTAPSSSQGGTGNTYKVYQQDIDWDKIDIKGRTNLQRAEGGLAPVGSDGKSMNLHHSKQNSKGPLFELRGSTHSKHTHSNILHPHRVNPDPITGSKAHPHNPVDRTSFDKDRTEYWKNRARTEKMRRKC